MPAAPRWIAGSRRAGSELAYAKFMRISLKQNFIFHTPKPHTNQQYMPKLFIIFISCLGEPKFAHSKAVSILHIMPSQRPSQSLAVPLPSDFSAPSERPMIYDSGGLTMASNARI